MKVTRKNLREAKKLCTTLACRVAHCRDPHCVVCGPSAPHPEAHHIIPRSRGWWYASDHDNVITLCRECHQMMHGRDPGWMELAVTLQRPEQISYTNALEYPIRASVAEVQARMDKLEAMLKEFS